MLELLNVLFLISMLIFVEHLDLVKRITSKKIVVSTTGVKKLECGTRLKMSLVKRFVPSILFFTVGVLDTGISRSTCSWAPSTGQRRTRGKPTTEAQQRRPS
jgi:hypothetical protein